MPEEALTSFTVSDAYRYASLQVMYTTVIGQKVGHTQNI